MDNLFTPGALALMDELDGTVAAHVMSGLSRTEAVAVLQQTLRRHEMALEADLDDAAADEALRISEDTDDDGDVL